MRPSVRAPCLVRRSFAVLVIAAAPVAAQLPVGAAERPALRARSADGSLRIDGRLTEAAWRQADSIAGLTQIEPREGAEPTGRTVVRVLSSGDAMVFGIRADDPEPARITSFARNRDANLSSEDHVRLVLDTHLDGRSGYVFIINPHGARYDALVANQGEGENSQWDAIWEAATHRDSAGWSAEILIPVKSLLFKRGLDAWGFNVERRIQRLLETSRWASPDRDVKINMTSRSGLLTGLPAFDLGAGLSVRPALASSVGRTSGLPTTSDISASLDITKRITSNTLGSLTVNTDFAETEVDTRRTNLTRFPLLFPEKRTFFLEGSDIFDFGLGLGNSSGSSGDLIPFFSRRIGLLAGREVPLEAGLKVAGREGATNFGALLVRTGRLDTLPTSNTLGVFRLKQNVLQQSSVGVIATFGDAIGRANSWTAGADLTYQTTRFQGDKNFLFGAWGLTMNRDGITGAGHGAIGAKIDYPNDLWDIALTWKRIGESFDPSLGFVQRPGVHALTLNITNTPRPRRPILGLRVRQMTNEWFNTVVTDLHGKWESYRVFLAPVNWRLESGDRYEINVVPTGERLAEPFEITDGIEIPAGSYHWKRYRLEAQLASKRRFSGQFSWWFGGFYSGTLDEFIATASWKPSALFILDLNATRNVGHLAEGNFTQQVIGARARISVSPDLQFNSYMQFDNSTKGLGSNTRVRWTFSPLGELFVVYNHNVRELIPSRGTPREWRFDSNQLLVKVQYAWRY